MNVFVADEVTRQVRGHLEFAVTESQVSLALGCGLALALAIAASGAENPGLQQTNVFVSGHDGYHTYRIPALVVSTNRTLLAFCEGRKTGGGDSGDVDLILKRSADGGQTWSEQQTVWSDAANTCGNPAPVVDQMTGVVWLLMTWNLGTDTENSISRGSSKNTRRVFVSHSDDDGRTWTVPAEITAAVKSPEWGWYATGPVNGIQLTRGGHRGRLVIPANHTELRDGEIVSRSHVIFSDDHGASWQLGGSEDEKTNESTLVELADGSLLQNMRSYHGKNRRAVAVSQDGGLTWSPVKLDETLIEPICQGSMLRLTWAGDATKSRILFCNPASVKRENLTVRFSYDEGVTWPISKVIHPGPSAYSCLARLADDSIGCLYECGEKRPYERISLGRFSLQSMETEKKP